MTLRPSGFDGAQLTQAAADALYVTQSGATMTGPLVATKISATSFFLSGTTLVNSMQTGDIGMKNASALRGFSTASIGRALIGLDANDLVSIDANGLGTVFGSGITVADGTFHKTSNALTNGAAAQVATMTNGPTAGNPTKWVPINDAGTIRYIPTW